MDVLLAEDDPTSAALLRSILTKAGLNVTWCQNGKQALESYANGSFDLIVTDWMMPAMDGITLIRAIRKRLQQAPPIILITSLTSPDARKHGMDSGADDFIIKPYSPVELIEVIRNVVARAKSVSSPSTPKAVKLPLVPPPFVAAVLAASTGGPTALKTVLSHLVCQAPAAYFIVQHGPAWMLEQFADGLQTTVKLPVHVPKAGMLIEPNTVYVAPGNFHMKVTDSFEVTLVDEPMENFVRPAADPLLRSVASVFRGFSVAVILTGLGRDGAMGAAGIHRAGGKVLVQDPTTATAPSMPESVLQLGVSDQVLPLEQIGSALSRAINRSSNDLITGTTV